MKQTIRVAVMAMLATALWAEAAPAQVIGTFSWQLQPYCHVLTLTVTQKGGTFTLEGTDDQCGAATRAGVMGVAFPNPNGTLGIALTRLLTPGGPPVHIDATLALPGVNGTWRDSAGHNGTFAFSAVGAAATGLVLTTPLAGLPLQHVNTFNFGAPIPAGGCTPTAINVDGLRVGDLLVPLVGIVHPDIHALPAIVAYPGRASVVFCNSGTAPFTLSLTYTLSRIAY